MAHNNLGRHPYDIHEQSLHNPNSLKVKQKREIRDGKLPESNIYFDYMQLTAALTSHFGLIVSL